MSEIAKFNIDPAHSLVWFTIKHLAIAKVKGEFTSVGGSLSVNPDDPSTLKIDATIVANTFHTNDDKRDAHVKSADFLDVEKYPEITFVSDGSTRINADHYMVTGKLSLHGVTKEISIDCHDRSDEITDQVGNRRFAIVGNTKINRNDFGVKFNAPLGTGGLMLGEELDIQLDLQFVRA